MCITSYLPCKSLGRVSRYSEIRLSWALLKWKLIVNSSYIIISPFNRVFCSLFYFKFQNITTLQPSFPNHLVLNILGKFTLKPAFNWLVIHGTILSFLSPQFSDKRSNNHLSHEFAGMDAWIRYVTLTLTPDRLFPFHVPEMPGCLIMIEGNLGIT